MRNSCTFFHRQEDGCGAVLRYQLQRERVHARTTADDVPNKQLVETVVTSRTRFLQPTVDITFPTAQRSHGRGWRTGMIENAAHVICYCMAFLMKVPYSPACRNKPNQGDLGMLLYVVQSIKTQWLQKMSRKIETQNSLLIFFTEDHTTWENYAQIGLNSAF